jgi:hypothetical protein
MQGRFLILAATLVLFLSAGVAGATPYTVQSQLDSVGNIWFPEFTLSNIINDIGVREVIVTDGTPGPVHAPNLIEFQMDNLLQSDVLAPTQSQSGSALADGSTIFATTMGLFYDFESEFYPRKKLAHESTEKSNAFTCMNGGGAECQGAAKYDAAVAILFSSKLDWSIFIVGSNCCSTEVWKWLLIEQFLSPSNLHFQKKNVSLPRIVTLRTMTHF